MDVFCITYKSNYMQAAAEPKLKECINTISNLIIDDNLYMNVFCITYKPNYMQADLQLKECINRISNLIIDDSLYMDVFCISSNLITCKQRQSLN